MIRVCFANYGRCTPQCYGMGRTSTGQEDSTRLFYVTGQWWDRVGIGVTSTRILFTAVSRPFQLIHYHSSRNHVVDVQFDADVELLLGGEDGVATGSLLVC